MTESLASVIEGFLAHRRSLGRKYHSEQAELRLLVRFADERQVHRLDQLTPVLLDEFLASRPRSRPRSFNHLLGVVACLLDWAVAQELLEASPLRAHRRRVTSTLVPFLFDAAQARRRAGRASLGGRRPPSRRPAVQLRRAPLRPPLHREPGLPPAGDHPGAPRP